MLKRSRKFLVFITLVDTTYTDSISLVPLYYQSSLLSVLFLRVFCFCFSPCPYSYLFLCPIVLFSCPFSYLLFLLLSSVFSFLALSFILFLPTTFTCLYCQRVLLCMFLFSTNFRMLSASQLWLFGTCCVTNEDVLSLVILGRGFFWASWLTKNPGLVSAFSYDIRWRPLMYSSVGVGGVLSLPRLLSVVINLKLFLFSGVSSIRILVSLLTPLSF